MRQLASVLLVTMFLSACGWDSGFDELGSPGPSAPDSVSWEGAPAQECTSDTDCALENPPGACEIAVCTAGACATVAAPIGTTCDPGGLDECEVGVCAASGESVICEKAAAPDGMPCGLSDWEPPTTIRTCWDGLCGAATECLTDGDCAGQDDGDYCNGVVTCQGRYCLLNSSSVVDCTGHPVGDCEVPACDPDTGACVAEAGEDDLACDDGDECTGDDLCAAGECLGETVLCETVCDDEIDEDDDGLTDCEDDECEDLPVCQGPECDDGECNDDETCDTCPEDCGACPACEDGECNGEETCDTCPEDCGECPAECDDGECSGDETCDTCPADCGACPACEDGECNGEETCDTCPADCGECPAECDDGECNGEETCDTCPEDCGACPPECDDGECNGNETCVTCEVDCGNCDDPAPLWFSEYVEGGANNKAVELFNGGDEAIDLSGCRINRYSNGDGLEDAAIISIAPEEETLLASGATWVVCHGSFHEPELSDGTCQFTTTALNHNGNDTLELICGSVPTDVFGKIGQDPGGNGWTGGDPPLLVSSKDTTLRRMCSVSAGDVDGTDDFDPSVEWEAFAKDTFDDLGAYVCL